MMDQILLVKATDADAQEVLEITKRAFDLYAKEIRKRESVAALYETLAREAPIVPICFKNQSVLTQWGQVTGLSPTRADPFAGDQWRIAQN